MREYRLLKLGRFWHIQEALYVGWWIFRKKVWIPVLPYYRYKEEALTELYKLNK
jgi:hypothetical protein